MFKKIILSIILLVTCVFADVVYDKAFFDYKSGNFKKAEKEFIFLNKKYPQDIKVMFYLGRVEYELKKYEQAYIYFDRILISHPNNVRARLELARTLYMLKSYKKAKEELKKAMVLPMPPTVRKNVEKYLSLINDKERGYKVSGAILFGIGFDNNINNNTYLETTKYGNIFVRNNTDKLKDYYHRDIILFNLDKYLKDNINLTTNLTFFNQTMRRYASNNISLIHLALGPKIKIGDKKFTFNLGVDRVWYGSSSFLVNLFVKADFNYIYKKSNIFNFGLKYLTKKNMQIENKVRDSNVKTVSAKYTKVFLKKIATSLSTSYNIERKKRGDRVDISNDLLNYKLTATYLLPKKWRVSLNFSKSRKTYKEKNIFLPKREDKKNNLSLNISKSFKNGWGSSLNISKIDNFSNIESYNYKKSVVLLNVSKSF